MVEALTTKPSTISEHNNLLNYIKVHQSPDFKAPILSDTDCYLRMLGQPQYRGEWRYVVSTKKIVHQNGSGCDFLLLQGVEMKWEEFWQQSKHHLLLNKHSKLSPRVDRKKEDEEKERKKLDRPGLFSTRRTLSQFWSFKIHRAAFLNYIKLAGLLTTRLWNCERVGRVCIHVQHGEGGTKETTLERADF